jgi:hypothetical protein
MESRRLLRSLLLCLLVAALAIVATLIAPGIVAASGGVFYRDGVMKRLPADVRAKLDAFEAEQERRRSEIRSLDRTLSVAATDAPRAIPGLLELRTRIANDLRSATAPVAVLPFHLNPQLLLWPAIYTALGWLVVVFRPRHSGVRMIRSSWLLAGLLVYVLYEWPLWARNFILSNEGRTVYAYPNADVHFASFVAQELVILGFRCCSRDCGRSGWTIERLSWRVRATINQRPRLARTLVASLQCSSLSGRSVRSSWPSDSSFSRISFGRSLPDIMTSVIYCPP